MDPTDRKLLALLKENAAQRYADLSERLHLSVPAIHERVKKLRARGVVRRTTVELDPVSVGLPLCAFVHVDPGDTWGPIAQEALRAIPEIEEVHSVTGDTGMILKVRTAGPEALESLLHRLYSIEGIQRTKTYTVLRSYFERGPDPMLAGEGDTKERGRAD